MTGVPCNMLKSRVFALTAILVVLRSKSARLYKLKEFI